MTGSLKDSVEYTQWRDGIAVLVGWLSANDEVPQLVTTAAKMAVLHGEEFVTLVDDGRRNVAGYAIANYLDGMTAVRALVLEWGPRIPQDIVVAAEAASAAMARMVWAPYTRPA